MSIKDSIEKIQTIIRACEQKNGRAENSVKLMTVSKFHSVDEIESAINAGSTLFGENRVQEACEKFPTLLQKYPHLELHQIGSLQRNKVKQILPYITCVQSVDRIELIAELEKCADTLQRPICVLLEVHTGEESKAGFQSYDALKNALHYLETCSLVVPKGFMTMAPFTTDKNIIRKSFRTLATMKEKLQNDFSMFDLSELSMGMSSDYEIAIEEGSTLVRVGTAIFGERKNQ